MMDRTHAEERVFNLNNTVTIIEEVVRVDCNVFARHHCGKRRKAGRLLDNDNRDQE